MSEQPRQNTATILGHIDKRLSVIEARLEILGDHETRIRELEKARYQSAIIISITTAVIVAGIVSVVTGAL
jgi:hypothetical protein